MMFDGVQNVQGTNDGHSGVNVQGTYDGDGGSKWSTASAMS